MRAYSGCLFGSIKIIQRSLIIPCFPILEDTSGLLHTFLSTLCTESVLLPPPKKIHKFLLKSLVDTIIKVLKAVYAIGLAIVFRHFQCIEVEKDLKDKIYHQPILVIKIQIYSLGFS